MLIAAGSNVPRYYGSSHVTNYYYVVHISFFKSSGQVYFFSFLKILEKMQQEARTIYFFLLQNVIAFIHKLARF